MNFNIKITLVYEKKLLGTAGTLIKNFSLYKKEDLLLIHTDNFFPIKLTSFINFHNSSKSKNAISMLSFITDHPSECGILELNKKNELIKIHEKCKNPPSNHANAAIYIIKNKTLKKISLLYPNAKNFIIDIIPKFYEQISVYKTRYNLIDIGTYKNFKKQIK